MVPESSSSISFSGDDFEFDIDFEFDAPRFYDFSRPELDSETEEIETWFQSSGNYPPSPFSPKFNWKFEPFKQITNTISDSKPVEIIESSLDTDTGLNGKDKFNGFIYYNQTVKDVSNTKSKSKTKPSNSTLTRPTASLLARQNKPLDIYSVQLLTRCQRSLAKFGENVSPILVSKLQNQDTNRQKMEAKVAPVSRRTKLTVPKEPNLRTAERSERHRSKVNSETEQIATSSSKRHIRNKNIALEPSSTSLPKSNTPRSKDLQAFRLRTSLRAKERSSNAKTDVIQENDATNSRTLMPIDSSKTRIVKENHSRKINCQVYESKTSPLDPKRSSKGKLGEAIRIEYGNQSSCRTDINRSLDLCRKFDSQEVARNLITA
ncbi:unnamed protein product [Arabidopsis lyrata]|uniref:uncharacterized protein LOC9300854 isoform X1 n=1 Tax=Arabidopsis lyrata subsp. lyrata TaxID=81972 RepID=UPI000A29AB14|nr:uncharacterized protein LOC9300854 isoform X1 [Arabidopsis lyrata subsp. lyrata]CAH8280537.1 unnamed protein product [Arabidopsis lyrata]|eukprot:XP_020871540.1 uncharacterized protein LOC9300854 isoform X1 [Arabidopsis lyrata subsp. lyrata]